MKVRQAHKILKKAAKKQGKLSPGKIAKAFKRIWHSSRFADHSPKAGQRMLGDLKPETLRICVKGMIMPLY